MSISNNENCNVTFFILNHALNWSLRYHAVRCFQFFKLLKWTRARVYSRTTGSSPRSLLITNQNCTRSQEFCVLQPLYTNLHWDLANCLEVIIVSHLEVDMKCGYDEKLKIIDNGPFTLAATAASDFSFSILELQNVAIFDIVNYLILKIL